MQLFKNVISLNQAAKISGYTQDYLGSLIRSGDIKGVKKGGIWFTTEGEITHYISKQKALHRKLLVRDFLEKVASKKLAVRDFVSHLSPRNFLVSSLVLFVAFSSTGFYFFKKYDSDLIPAFRAPSFVLASTAFTSKAKNISLPTFPTLPTFPNPFPTLKKIGKVYVDGIANAREAVESSSRDFAIDFVAFTKEKTSNNKKFIADSKIKIKNSTTPTSKRRVSSVVIAKNKINVGSSLTDISDGVSYGWGAFIGTIIDNAKSSADNTKKLASSFGSLTNYVSKASQIKIVTPQINLASVASAPSPKPVLHLSAISLSKVSEITKRSLNSSAIAFSQTTASVGSSLTDVSGGVSYGWGSFINGFSLGVDSFVDKIRSSARAFLGITDINPKIYIQEIPVIVKVPDPLRPSGTSPLAGGGNTNTGSTTIQKIYITDPRAKDYESQQMAISELGRSILPRIQGIELAILNNISHNSVQTERVYDSTGNNLSNAIHNLTQSGTFNSPTLNDSTFANFTSTGRSDFTRVPTLAHSFTTWPDGTSNAANATLYINPAASVGNGNLIGASVADVVKFIVDAEGSIYANSLVLTGSVTSGATTVASLSVLDNTILGDAGTDTLTVNSGSTFNNNISQVGAYTFGTGTSAVSLNGDTTIATGKAFTVTNGTTGILGTTSINTSGSNTTDIGTGTNAGTITIGNITTGDLALNDANWNITGLGAANFTSIGVATQGSGAFTTISASSTGNALTLSGAGANIYFSGAGLAQITTVANQNLAIMPGGTGKIGIGTTEPQGLLSIAGGDVYIDSSDQNAGTLPNGSVGPGLRFGGISTGEGIASNRTNIAGNQYGLDFYTSYINRMAITNTGSVGIGTTAPTSMLSVGATSQFQVNSTGAIVASTGITSTGNATISTAINSTNTFGTGTGAINTFGNATGTNAINGTSTFGGDILASTGSINIGSTGTHFGTVYADNVTASNIYGTIVTGSTSANDWTINSDNVTVDTEDMSLAFERGTLANATLIWDATGKKFILNAPLELASGIGTATFLSPGLATFTSGLTSNGAVTVQNNSNLIIASGTGTFSQTYTGTTTTASTITADSLTTGIGQLITSTGLTSGSLLSLTSAGTAGLTGQKGINVSLSGANATLSQTTYGAYLSNTHTGTSTNVGLYATATGGTNNYAAIFENGNVGIGVIAPTAVLHLKAGSATANTAPLKFTSGALLTTPEAGAVEFNNSGYYGTTATLAVGDSYGGGIVAYILQAGDPGYDATQVKGIIAATTDQSTGIIWATVPYQSTLVPGGTSTNIGTGSANTDKIITQNTAGSTYAAGLARAYNGGGYSDWYLPSQDELNKLYLNQAAIGGFFSSVSIHYWSSTENGSANAYGQNFSNGGYYGGKNNTYYVRPVRSFSTPIRGKFAFTTDMANTYVPYTGATSNVNLGIHNLTVDTNSLFVDSVNHRVGVGTLTPTNALSFDGTTSHTIWMERNTTAATAGQGLTLSSGGATLATTDKVGGDLILKSGISTGTGDSALRFFTATPQGSTNTTDNTPTEKMTILGNGNVGIGLIAPTAILNIKAGSDIPNGAPLKLTSGALTTGANITAGSIEFLTDAYYGTISTGPARKTFAFLESPSFTTPSLGAATSTGLSITSANTTQATTASALALNVNSLTTGTGFYTASSSLSSGSLFDLAITGTAGLTNQKGINVSLSGANATLAQTTYGAYLSNTHTGTSTNVGLYTIASGGTNNYSLQVNSPAAATGTYTIYANGAAQNYFAGNIGIGDAAPGTKLSVVGTAQIGYTTGTTVSAGTSLAVSGNVGIGTTNPGAKLEVDDNGSIDGLKSVTYNGNAGYFSSSYGIALSTGSGSVGIGTSTGIKAKLEVKGGDILVSPASNNTNGVMGKIGFGPDGTYSGLSSGAYIQGNYTGSSWASGTKLTFYTAPGPDITYGGGPVERMAILGNGNVGIGTTNPGSLLHVAGDVSITGGGDLNIIDNRGGTGTDPITITLTEQFNGNYAANAVAAKINFASSDASGGAGYAGTRAAIKMHVMGATGTVNDLSFWTTAAGAGNIAERMRITGAGILGIGYTADQGGGQLLQVNSGAYINGNVGIGTTGPLAILHIIKDGTVQRWGYNSVVNDVLYNLQLNQVVTSGNVRWSFDQTNNGVSYPNTLVFNQGNVGIGTTNPVSKLTVDAGKRDHIYFTTSGETGNNKIVGFFSPQDTKWEIGPTAKAIGAVGPRIDIMGEGYSNRPDTIELVTGDTARFTLTTDGNVGIGTTSPTAKLHIATLAGTNPNFIIERAVNTDTTFLEYDTAGAGSAYLGLLRANGTGPITSGGLANALYFRNVGGAIQFGDGSPNVTILNTGNVGIGTTSPGEKLTISVGNLLFKNASAVSTSQGIVKFANPSYLTQYGGIEGRTNAAADQIQLAFYTSGNSGVPSEKMTILADGNVGIGTTGPTGNLHVYGASGATVNIDGPAANNSALQFMSAGSSKIGLYRPANTNDLRLDSSTVAGIMSWTNNGNVGIGTTGPGVGLSTGGSTGTVLQVSGTASGGYPIIAVTSANTADGAFFEQQNDTGVTNTLVFGTFGSTNANSALYGVARANASFINKNGNLPLAIGTQGTGNLILGTNNTANVTIQSGGNVGIGTTNPGAKLDIANSTTLGAEIRLREGTTNGVSYIGFKAPNAITTAVTYQFPEAPGTSGFVLASTTAGVMSWVDNAAGTGMTNPMLAVGDLIYASAAGTPATPAKLGIGTAGQVLETYDSGAGVMLPRWGSGGGLAVGGDGTPAGQIQFSTGGGVQAMDGDAEFYYDTTNKELSIVGSKSGSKRLQVTNTLAGTSADSGINLGTNSGADQLSLRINSSAFDTYGGYSYLWSKANAPMIFGVNDAEAMRIAADGSLVVIGSITGAGGAFTTLTSSGATTLGTGASSINTIGSVTTPGALTLHGATTLDSTFLQTGANTFGTGTGAVSLNGATAVTGTNTFTVGTGLTTLGGNLTVTGTAWTATPTISGLITATSGITSTGALIANGTSTFNNTITQTGANTFSTGTGAVSLNGAVSVTGTNTFNVGTGLATLGGNLTVTGTAWTATPTISGLITATSGITSTGAIIANGISTFNNNISQVGTGTFSTGTGAVSLNGATTVTGLLTANNFASSSSAISGGTITGTTIDNSTIGITIPVAGNFTTIGITTQGSGAFTTLTASTSLLTPTLDTATAVAMNIGTTTQNALTLGRVGATTAINGSTITLGSATTTAISLGNITTNPTLTLLGTGITTLGGTLQVGSGSIADAVARFTNSSGYCDINPLTASLVCTSDMNLKKNITNIKDNIEFALQTVPTDMSTRSTFEKVMTLTPVKYNWKTEADTATKHVGFIAQEVEQVFPDLVFTDPVTGLKSVAFTNLLPYTIEAVQEMNLKLGQIGDMSKPNIFRSAISSWLENSSNKITRIFTGEVCLTDPDGQTECINRAELKSLKTLINTSGTASVVVPTTTVIPAQVDPASQETAISAVGSPTPTGEVVAPATTGTALEPQAISAAGSPVVAPVTTTP